MYFRYSVSMYLCFNMEWKKCVSHFSEAFSEQRALPEIWHLCITTNIEWNLDLCESESTTKIATNFRLKLQRNAIILYNILITVVSFTNILHFLCNKIYLTGGCIHSNPALFPNRVFFPGFYLFSWSTYCGNVSIFLQVKKALSPARWSLRTWTGTRVAPIFAQQTMALVNQLRIKYNCMYSVSI